MRRIDLHRGGAAPSRYAPWHRVARAHIVAVALILLAVAPGHADHQRAAQLGPVRLTYPQLMSIVAAARRSAGSANAAFVPRPGDSPFEQLSAQSDDASVSVRSGFRDADLLAAPEGATHIKYWYYLRDAPISEIRIDLWDMSREISVSGQSPEQALDTLNILRERLDAHEVVLGGFQHRSWGGLMLGLLAVVGWLIGGFFVSFDRRTAGIIFLVGATVLQLIIWIAPWKAWLPGAVVYSGDAPWIIRNAAEIGFLSLLVGVAGIGFTAVQVWKPAWLFRKKDTTRARPSRQRDEIANATVPTPTVQPASQSPKPPDEIANATVPTPTVQPASQSPKPPEDRDR